MTGRTKTRRRRHGGALVAMITAASCQCRDQNTGKPCGNEATGKGAFCAIHKKTCPVLPLSGFEPRYEPQLYNKDPSVYKSHNCYSYSMNVIDKLKVLACRKYKNDTDSCRANFHQPGSKYGARNALNVEARRTCNVVEQLLQSDVPEIRRVEWNAVCPEGYSKIALVVSRGKDYHFYRQDANGRWSHKDGSNPVKNFDALGRPIFDPELASRDYRPKGSDLNYADFCGFYCVPRDRILELERAVDGLSARAQAQAQPLPVGAPQAAAAAGGGQVSELPLTGRSWTDWPSRSAQRTRRLRSVLRSASRPRQTRRV
jgi:hypothetical protein